MDHPEDVSTPLAAGMPKAMFTRRAALGLAGLSVGAIVALTVGNTPAQADSEPTWGHPLNPRGTVSSGFRTAERPTHDGIDFWNNIAGSRVNDPIYSVADGYVSFSGSSGDYGNLVIVTHADGWSSRYAHTPSGAILAVGTSVSRGTQIANIGSTGNAQGPHLHLEILTGSTWVDPQPRVENAPLPGEATAESNESWYEEMAVIVSSSTDSYNGIWLAAPGYWHMFTGEEWTQFNAHGLREGMTVVTPVNDRDFDVIRDIYTQASAI
ncbi:MAG: M23 family metallopeptidase [Microbacterium sp.]|uniref:M23 family metallopeptidase n=1 Tax=Microbacterium sp. TaxID=51671 RepID=UPI0039E70701